MKICIFPKPDISGTGGVIQVVNSHKKILEKNGYEFTENESEADIIICHAMTKGKKDPDITICHGLYPTNDHSFKHIEGANEQIIDNLLRSKVSVFVCNWAAEFARRELHISPEILSNGIFRGNDKFGNPEGPVIWPKTRIDPVCNPEDMIKLSSINKNVNFVSVAKFENRQENISFIGLMSPDKFEEYMKKCSIYLGITKENSSIGTMQAMSFGIPVVGYDYGFNKEALKNGFGCELVQPGDIQGLDKALNKVLENWSRYSEDAFKYSEVFDWSYRERKLIEIVEKAYYLKNKKNKFSIIIPSHNYGHFIERAVNSCLNQSVKCEVIVVDDNSKDDTLERLKKFGNSIKVIALDKNLGVANARNTGIAEAEGDFITCLDADDELSTTFIETVSIPLLQNRRIGISFSPIMGYINGMPHSEMFSENFDYRKHASGMNKVPTMNIFRKEAWKRAGGYRKRYQIGEDADLWLRITAIGYFAVRATDRHLANYFSHSGGLMHTGKNDGLWYKDKPWVFYYAGQFFGKKIKSYDSENVIIVIDNVSDINDLYNTLDSLESQSYFKYQVYIISENVPEIIKSGFPFAKIVKSKLFIPKAKILKIVCRSGHVFRNFNYLERIVKNHG